MSTASEIPNLERLLRNVCRLALETEHGSTWVDHLSKQFGMAMANAGARAREKRPEEILGSDFDAVGLSDLASLLRSPAGHSIVEAAWESREAAQVDLDRLVRNRDKNLHEVGPPSGQIVDDEVAAIVTRLRVRLEAYRRDLMGEQGQWWPYIESATSNVPEFCS